MNKHDLVYEELKRLAIHLWKTYYQKESPEWEVLDTSIGVITQIDNMLTGLTKATEEHE